MGPSYANLFVGFIENKFFSNYHGSKPDLYKRYIDDCVGATPSSKEELNLFQSFHPALQYTWEISENSLAFLDIKLSINDQGLSTSVHYKPTDSHNYLLHSSSHQRTQCKTCPFVSNTVKISGPNRSVKVTDHFTCISTNVIYCITCTLCKKIYIGETGRRLADRFCEHLRDVEKNNTDASKPVARQFQSS